ncbi:unnamed protein product [Closterium sp. Naga37s-1]|nr:unnamed protein product [Closterium sp. Naga37s-1]
MSVARLPTAHITLSRLPSSSRLLLLTFLTVARTFPPEARSAVPPPPPPPPPAFAVPSRAPCASAATRASHCPAARAPAFPCAGLSPSSIRPPSLTLLLLSTLICASPHHLTSSSSYFLSLSTPLPTLRLFTILSSPFSLYFPSLSHLFLRLFPLLKIYPSYHPPLHHPPPLLPPSNSLHYLTFSSASFPSSKSTLLHHPPLHPPPPLLSPFIPLPISLSPPPLSSRLLLQPVAGFAS